MDPTLPPLPRSGPLRKRTAWEVQRSVLLALVLREMKSRVGGQWIGAVWTLIEPLMQVLVMLTILSMARGGGVDTDVPLFLATGMVPFSLFQNLANRMMDGIEANRGLFSYRQVKPLDTLMSRAVVELIMNGFVYIVTLGILGWLGLKVLPAGPLEALGVHALLFMLGAGFGTCAAMLSYDRPRTRTFIRVSMLPLYLISGVVFPVHLVPADARALLMINPLLHLIELSRQAFMPDAIVLPGVSLMYPLLWALSLCALALALYRVNRLRLVTST